MSTIVLVIHLMVAVALITVVLLQRSEGGALGIGGGGGGGGGGFMSGRGTANMLTRMTTILAGIFFLTSIGLTILAGQPGTGGSNILEKIDRGTPASSSTGTGSGSGGGILDKIQPPSTTSIPATPAPE